jgi:hypothetical protein
MTSAGVYYSFVPGFSMSQSACAGRVPCYIASNLWKLVPDQVRISLDTVKVD